MSQIIEIKPGSASAVITLDKVLTIQQGVKHYHLGDSYLIDPQDGFTLPVDIIRVTYSKLKDIQITDLVIHGEKTWEELQEYLENYYPGITGEDAITVARFDYKKE